MAVARVNDIGLSFELIGTSGSSWVITPGGRFSKDEPGVRQLAEVLAAGGNRVLIWDRPNCGESDVCFRGSTESEMQADALAGLIAHLDLGPAVVMGGSGGSRVSLLAVASHPEIAAALAVVWPSGGVLGLLELPMYYCGDSLRAAWTQDMAAVAELPVWAEVIRRNPRNKQRILDQDRHEFMETMKQWMLAYCPREDEHIPSLPDDRARAITVPAIVFRSGESDASHPRAVSEALAALMPNALLAEPPWPDTEWNDGQRRWKVLGEQRGPFERWPLLGPQLLSWARDVLT